MEASAELHTSPIGLQYEVLYTSAPDWTWNPGVSAVPDTQLYTEEEAARLLAVSPDTMKRLRTGRKIACRRVGPGDEPRLIRYHRDDIAEYEARSLEPRFD